MVLIGGTTYPDIHSRTAQSESGDDTPGRLDRATSHSGMSNFESKRVGDIRMADAERGLVGLALLTAVGLAFVSISMLLEQPPEAQLIQTGQTEGDDAGQSSEEITSETAPSEPAPRQYERSEVARVATFNIQVFGRAKMAKTEVVDELVQIFSRYDMVVVQEIKDIEEQVPYQFLDALNNGSTNTSAIGPTNGTNGTNGTSDRWQMLLSVRSGRQPDDANSEEQYAFYYRPEVFLPIGNGTLYDDSSNDSFQREPYTARFALLDVNGTNTGSDFVFVTVHTDPAVAVYEMTALAAAADWAAAYHSDDDIILLGDFNAGCSYASDDELAGLTIRSASYTWLVPDDADTTVGDNICAYDRIVTRGDLDGRSTGNWAVDEDISSKSVSDHRPVWFDFARVDA